MLVSRIKFLCLKNSITIKELEIAVGLSNGAIGKWDKSCPKADTIAKIADYFQVSIDYLLGRTETSEKYTDEIKSEILEIYDQLTPEQQQELMEYAKFKASQNK